MACKTIQCKQSMTNNGKWLVEVWLYQDGRPLRLIDSQTFPDASYANRYIYDAHGTYAHLCNN